MSRDTGWWMLIPGTEISIIVMNNDVLLVLVTGQSDAK
jgi:hypothetical protein